MHSSNRNGAKVIWLAVHTTEGIMRAADLRAWTTWAGSSHASSDETGALLTPDDGFVPYDRAAWTLRNGNAISDNIEQCGWARWTREEWLARPKLLDATARWLADRSKARGIPLVKLSPADVAARKPGVLGHGDYSTGTGDGTHWDPGPGYPWDVVLEKARTYAASGKTTTAAPSEEDDTVKYLAYRSDPKQKDPSTGKAGNGAVALAAPGQWYGVPSPAYLALLKKLGVCGEEKNVSPNEFAYLRSVFMQSELNDEEIQAVLAGLAADEPAA